MSYSGKWAPAVIRAGRRACRCKPGDPDPCGYCQRHISWEEEVRGDPALAPDYDELVDREERAYERWLDALAG